MADKIEPFGLSVRACRNGSWAIKSPGELNGAWSVFLPHKCDDWDIAYRVGPEEAVAALEAFVAEAQAALVALKAHQEFGKDD
jgi:hypothetical protein